MKRAAFIFIACCSVMIQALASPRQQSDAQEQASEGWLNANDNWLDKSHSYVADGGDALANWLDDFFGTRSSDIDAAHSLLRVSAIYDVDQIDGNRMRYKARGKLRLPQLKNRFYIVFSGNEDGDEEEQLLSPREADDDNQAGLQYEFKENKRSRIGIFATFNSGFKYKAGVRYRYDIAPLENFSARFSEEIAYQQRDRLISTTRSNLAYYLQDDQLLRWSSRIRYGEETDGIEWDTQWGWQERIAPTKAITYFFAVNGDTGSTNTVQSFGPGVRYRQNIFRDYLFFDVGTAYGWRKNSDFSGRKTAWSVEFQLEIFFDNKKEKRDQARR